MKGWHKANSGHYCAAHLRPIDADPADLDQYHPDFDFWSNNVGTSRETPETYQERFAKLIASCDQTNYRKNWKLTGLSKPSILCGLHSSLTLPVPLCFKVDLMHLLFLNIGDLLLPLWRGIIRYDATDDRSTWDWVLLTGGTWIEHGKLVAEATQYFPSSFHQTPQNPAEKISSRYKATEWFLYLFGLGVGFFWPILPQKYWWHFCKLVCGAHIVIQRCITGKQLCEAHKFLCEFVEEFELLYYQHRTDWLHFCHPSLHTLLHICPETDRVSPGGLLSQFPLERAIGDLGKSIQQPATPFANLIQIALRQSQVSALKTMCPILDKDAVPSLPQHSHDLGNGYVLLQPWMRYANLLDGQERIAVSDMMDNLMKLRKWGCLYLPNGQVACSLFSEQQQTAKNKRNSQNIKVPGSYLDNLNTFINFLLVQAWRKGWIHWSAILLHAWKWRTRSWSICSNFSIQPTRCRHSWRFLSYSLDLLICWWSKPQSNSNINHLICYFYATIALERWRCRKSMVCGREIGLRWHGSDRIWRPCMTSPFLLLLQVCCISHPLGTGDRSSFP